MRDYEIRMRIVSSYLLLFTVDKVNHRVQVIAFRHGSQLPIPGDLPE